MKPSLAFPYHDPAGTMLPHLRAILPDLKAHFERAYICPPFDTHANASVMEILSADPFFTIFALDKPMRIGEHFTYLYTRAAQTADPDEIIHLCYVDRLAFALEGAYRESFLADVDVLRPDDLPLIFHRSPFAWATHPRNYAQIEGLVTQVGENLFGQTLDYGWCHLVAQASQLREVMPKVTHKGLSMVAEIVLHLQHSIHTCDVDWLAWEDPFIFGRDAAELKAERENSSDEYEKRLSYCLPMVDALTQFAMNAKKEIHV